VRKKKSYHHGNLRQDLVAAAVQLIGRSSPEDMTLRAVTKRLGVTAAATYRHFANKEALLGAVAAEGFTTLLAESRTMMEEAGPDPVARYESMAVAYLRFAMNHPHHFRIMYGPHVDFERVAVPERRAAYLLLSDAIEACQAAGLARPGKPYEIANQAWAYTHGLVTLYLHGLLHRSLDVPAMTELVRQIRVFLSPSPSTPTPARSQSKSPVQRSNGRTNRATKRR
jgi:AcrR family transcriptional regulator